MRTSFLLRVTLCLGAAVVWSGCTQVVGIKDVTEDNSVKSGGGGSAGGGGGGGAAGCPQGQVRCGTCMVAEPCMQCCTTACAAESNACANNPDCVAVWQCAFNCPKSDSNCTTNCVASHPGGAGAAVTLANCMTKGACASSCT